MRVEGEKEEEEEDERDAAIGLSSRRTRRGWDAGYH